MKALHVLSKHLIFVTPLMHKVRRLSLFASIESAMDGGSLSVTGLGRNINNHAKEKHRIKRVDRLCNNHHLQRETKLIYARMVKRLVGQNSRPIILVDWSDLDNRKQHFLIRASLAAQGRALTLYEEIHPLVKREKPAVHLQFMKQLKAMLPSNCRPIIVTDAGFRIPWFRLIESLNWDYVGRVRGRTNCKKKAEMSWRSVKELYAKATSKAKNLGCYQLGAQQLFELRLIVFKRLAKGRKHKTANGKQVRKSKLSRACAQREKEPWLLATSLETTRCLAKKVVSIYATRMQIEESFRDLKTGLKMNEGDTRTLKRLSILLLIASLAQYLLFLLGLATKEAGAHHQYQANSVKQKNVLSNQFIGLRAYKDNRLKLLKKHWQAAEKTLTQLILKPEAYV